MTARAAINGLSDIQPLRDFKAVGQITSTRRQLFRSPVLPPVAGDPLQESSRSRSRSREINFARRQRIELNHMARIPPSTGAGNRLLLVPYRGTGETIRDL